MIYTITAHETEYRNTRFRSRLEARYAAFFDLFNRGTKDNAHGYLHWAYEPVDLMGWVPDFLLRFVCRHSECTSERTYDQQSGYATHNIYVEIKPYQKAEEFEGHPCVADEWFFENPTACGLGITPLVSTETHIVHGPGGGWGALFTDSMVSAMGDEEVRSLWEEAGNITRWRK